jgi:prepilin signal peptidase PulO-like enzyme (type II secretory pathway)
MTEIFENPMLFLSTILLISLCVGSFLNVVIYRLPLLIQKNQEISSCFGELRSACINCHKKLPFRAIFPIFSYLFLRGLSRCCQKKIPIRYLMVETLTAIFSLLFAIHFGFGITLFFSLFFLWGLIILTFIDFETFLLPDQITIPLLWFGLVGNTFNLFTSLKNAVFGAITGYLFCFFLEKIIIKIKHVEGLGRGDAKCLAMLGAWLGFEWLPTITFIASITGTIYGFCYIVYSKRKITTPLPLGPFLALSGIICLFSAKN